MEYKNGFPDYKPFSKGEVDIPMQGNRTSDFTNADKAMREKLGDPNWERPSGHTWHHNENGVTMELIPQNVHATGGGAWKGDWGGALFDVVGFVPIFGDAAKAGRIANKLVDLKRGVDAAASGVARMMNKTKSAATKYWDDIIKRNKAAYEEALKKCNGSKACKEAAALKKGPQYTSTPHMGGASLHDGSQTAEF